MRYMPLFIDLHGRNVLVIGGGRVALRKAIQLSKAGAELTIIAPQIADELKNLPAVNLIERKAQINDVSARYFLTFIASSDSEANSLIAEECQKLGLLFNRCDSFADGNFITGKTIARGEIICSTISGGVPEISRQLNNSIEELISPELAELSTIISELRPAIKASARINQDKQAFIARWVNESVLERIRTEGCEKLRQEILACL